MLGTGFMTWQMVKEDCFIGMVMFMKENGSTINLMELGLIIQMTDQNTIFAQIA